MGASANEDTFTAAANAAMQQAQPRQFNAFKVDLAKETLKETLLIVAS